MTFKSAGRVLLMALVSILGVNLALAAVCDGVSEAFNSTLETVDVVTGLDRPLLLISPPGDTDRFFVIEQPGRIRLLKRGDAPSAHTNFMDITDRVVGIGGIGDERGLLGLAFHPDYQNNGLFYVNYINTSGNTVVSRFVRTDADHGNPTTERSVISISQPQSNHNGGWISFGPDGFLYIGTGDGGGANDAGTGHGSCGNGQDTDNLLGAMLRLDVDFLPGSGASECGGGLYQVPADNPFVGVSGCDEIWAYGLRNPWRFSFDPATGWLWLGDVGQNAYEEIDIIENGTNYGWNIMEGNHCYPSDPCNMTGLELPIWEYTNYHIFLSISSKKEINTEYLLHILQGRDKSIIVPKVTVGTPNMEHFLLQDNTALKLSKYGVPEPVSGIEILPKKMEVIFIPLLAYDTIGNRLGYGKGFYDRFLSQCNPEAIFIGLSFFEPETTIPFEETDIPLHYCITPKRVILF